MKTKIFIVGLIFLFVSPLIAEEEVVFESVLKDAVFCPIDPTTVIINHAEKYQLPWMGWWTLKFENGAVIAIKKSFRELPKLEIWWIGKRYKVIKEKLYFRAELVE